MFALIFVIWFIFVIACVILEKTSENGIFTFLFLLSLPIIFYVPLFLK